MNLRSCPLKFPFKKSFSTYADSKLVNKEPNELETKEHEEEEEEKEGGGGRSPLEQFSSIGSDVSGAANRR